MRVRALAGWFRRTFYALENSQFRLLWIGTLFSFLGMQMQVVARGYLAYDLTGKNSALGAVMLAFGVPQLLLGLWGGVLADRLPKRNLLFVCQGIIALNSAWVAVMIGLGQLEYWMLIVAGVVQGSGFAFVGPARQAFIGDLVGRDSIGNAVVLQQLSMNSTRVIGPSLAGAFIAVAFIGTAGVYIMTTAGFFIAMFTLLRLPPGNPGPRETPASPLADLADGVRYVAKRPSILLLILTSFAVITIGFPYQSFLPSVAKDVYGVGSGGLGMLQSAGAVGAVVATMLVATYANNSKAWVAQPLLAVAFGLSLVGLGIAPNFALGLAAMVSVGALAGGFQGINNSLTMSSTDAAYHGRVQSISMLSWSMFGLAALPIGILADHIGIQQTMVVMGVVVVSLVVLLQLFGRSDAVATDRHARAHMTERRARAGARAR
ncbi:MAG TPA: MFS transporter [Tepidiformaceae bacterium]|nr:MFS transporter [Tepidiformaceae bacterium]